MMEAGDRDGHGWMSVDVQDDHSFAGPVSSSSSADGSVWAPVDANKGTGADDGITQITSQRSADRWFENLVMAVIEDGGGGAHVSGGGVWSTNTNGFGGGSATLNGHYSSAHPEEEGARLWPWSAGDEVSARSWNKVAMSSQSSSAYGHDASDSSGSTTPVDMRSISMNSDHRFGSGHISPPEPLSDGELSGSPTEKKSIGFASAFDEHLRWSMDRRSGNGEMQHHQHHVYSSDGFHLSGSCDESMPPPPQSLGRERQRRVGHRAPIDLCQDGRGRTVPDKTVNLRRQHDGKLWRQHYDGEYNRAAFSTKAAALEFTTTSYHDNRTGHQMDDRVTRQRGVNRRRRYDGLDSAADIRAPVHAQPSASQIHPMQPRSVAQAPAAKHSASSVQLSIPTTVTTLPGTGVFRPMAHLIKR